MNAADAALVLAQGLGKSYRGEGVMTHALRDVELRVEAGEFIAITGASGSGKSTMLALLGLMEPHDHGTLRLFGEDVAQLDARGHTDVRCRNIGFVFQFFHLLGDLSVRDNVALPMHYAGVSATQVRTRVNTLLERLGLAHRACHYPAQLSGGQQQRVAIARALANDPPLLLVDEPTGNLDSVAGAEVMALLREVHAAGKTVCLVTHDAALAAQAQRRIVLRDGRIHSDG
jgi:putative ABC transport system ATP-binding protein